MQVINYLTRLGSVIIINKKRWVKELKNYLNMFPAVFPAIIFPATFLNDSGNLVLINDPKVIGISIAFIVGIISKNLIITIMSGLFFG